jgi:aquaporin Z
MLNYVVEFIGTFIFLSVIINTGMLDVWGFGALSVGLALTTAIYFGGKVSGGMFNPAVSTMFLIKGDLNGTDYIGYVVAQILGAVAALYFYKSANVYINNKK